MGKYLDDFEDMEAVFPTHRLIRGGAPQIQHRPPHIAFRYYFFNAI